jgi:hypothetical protein
MGLSGILVALFFLIWLAYRGGSVLLLAPAAALVAAAATGEPLLAGRRPSWEARDNLWHSPSGFFFSEPCLQN